MSHYKRYPSYRDSGVEWLGDVPEHWKKHKLSHSFSTIGSGTTPPTTREDLYSEDGIPWITTGELREGVVERTAKCVTSTALAEFPTLRVYPKGALAVAMYGATIGRLGILGVPATTNQACCVIAGEKSLSVRFLFYWLLASKQPIIDLYAAGGGQPNINQEVIASQRVPAPQMAEQTAIAEALDRETTRIDALIEKKTRFIELLKEKRQALITQAVTKGLDPSVKMKDSGVEWLGEVPEHWKVMALKRLVSCPITDGPHETPQRHNNGVPFVSAEAIKNGVLDFNRIWGYISVEDNVRYSKKYRPKKNDIYMVKSGATTGATAIVNDNVDFNIWSPLAAIRPNSHVLPNFLLAAIRSTFFQDGIALNWSYGTQQNIGMKTLSNLPVFVPPKEEQSMLMQKVGALVEKHDQLINKSQISIELLKERRSALITAAVTGQIDLRDAA